ncbi:MAG: AAA family ATPase [Anaerolineaceae bacterium]|nr:AAA family ATPase [Anaerolineaceae bacterium]
MGSRQVNAEPVYAAAAEWVERCLQRDDSLFTSGREIWSARLLSELRSRFGDQPDETPGRPFLEKLSRQLEGAPAPVVQLMGEALYVHFLIVWTQDATTERRRVEEVLSLSPEPVQIPPQLVDGLTPGLAGVGQAYHRQRPFGLAVIIEFAEQLKQRTPGEQQRLLADPWAFKEFLLSLEPRSQLLRERPHWGGGQRHALLHLVHPDSFEPIVSLNHKQMIASAFSRSHEVPVEDVDRRLGEIRARLEASTHGESFDFYRRDIRQRWDDDYQADQWDELVARARSFLDSGRLELDENDYKLAIAARLADARAAVLAGSNDWPKLVKTGIGKDNNLVFRLQLARFRDWVDESPEQALSALKALWTNVDVAAPDRIRRFAELLPGSASGGVAVRTTLASVLLMGLDARNYPPYQKTLFAKAYDISGYDPPDGDQDEAAQYHHALGFLDRFIEAASERGLQLRHRLDAQSVVWGVFRSTEQPPGTPEPVGPADLEELADQLNLPREFLEEIELLLEDKRQVIFQGPPGTGKTFVAQQLAHCLAAAEERVTLIQFHPSYAYEDFVQGYRPALVNGQPSFELRNGPLLLAAEAARAEAEAKHFLVIDELNRGNLAKVFGELYFLLEYRDWDIRLQYSSDAAARFSLPENLYIIGTMNTADRSIALVDLALRRRFHFVEFSPDRTPIQGLLRRWLEQHELDGMSWLADVVDLANEQLSDDRHAAIGPSHFMKPGLDSEAVERTWRHSVLPYLEERLLGSAERIDEFALNRLRDQAARRATAEPDSPSTPEEEAAAADAAE